jgi:hypothetical protein
MKVEWLMLADSAQVINNKLYALGGGWESLAAAGDFPFRYKFSVALAFLVEWMEADKAWPVQVELAFDDPRQIMINVAGELRVGRPVGLPEGQAQRVQYGMEVDAEFAQPGQYVVRAQAGESEWRQIGFRVIDARPAG